VAERFEHSLEAQPLGGVVVNDQDPNRASPARVLCLLAGLDPRELPQGAQLQPVVWALGLSQGPTTASNSAVSTGFGT